MWTIAQQCFFETNLLDRNLAKIKSFFKESIFLTTIYGLYFSHHFTYAYKLHFLHDTDLCGQLFVYCINNCLSDLWVLLIVAVLLFFHVVLSLIYSNSSEKIDSPLLRFDPGTSPVASLLC